ncbi:MAG: NAD(P)-dependent oxidoreductase [Pirellula sp.]|nr:NAD(P)-dependent oxidoreductase [Pirellula sp.]
MKLLFGCGYLGWRVARLWRDAGDEVVVVTRDEAKAEQLRSDGFRALTADVCEPATLRDLPPAETVLYAVGFDRRSATTRSIGEVYAGGVGNVLDALSAAASAQPGSPTPLFIYISSTGVYGDAVGDWVDEDSPCRPLREGGKACLAAEEVLAAHPLGADSVVLRLAGIYGPGRIPRADALRRGEPIDAPADGYLNLIHVDDAAHTVLAVERGVAPPRTYCVADGRPPFRREYYAELARLLGAPAPTFVEPTADSPAAARAAADKRISNARLLREIGVDFQYPSYREGLAAIVRA